MALQEEDVAHLEELWVNTRLLLVEEPLWYDDGGLLLDSLHPAEEIRGCAEAHVGVYDTATTIPNVTCRRYALFGFYIDLCEAEAHKTCRLFGEEVFEESLILLNEDHVPCGYLCGLSALLELFYLERSH